MEGKCLKTPVFMVENVFRDSAEVPVDIEFNLPDYCPEVSKILKCRAVARISSKSSEGRNISVDGAATITVMYSDDDNNINSYEYQYPFSKTFETGIDVSDAFIFVKVKCEYINCRAVTERKIDIHGAVGITVTASKRKSRDIISDIDDQNVEVLRTGAPTTMPMGSAEKYALIEEELPIGSSQPDIRCLIRYDADVSVSECKLMAGKAIVKGNMDVSLIYRTEDGGIQPFNSTVPFSQLMEIDGAGEDCNCEVNAEISYLEIKPKFNSSGEARSFTLDAKLCLKADSYCQNDVEVIADAYSRKFEAEITSEDFCFEKMVLSINDTFNIRKGIDFSPDFISEVYDVWATANADNAKFDGDCLLASGDVTLSILAADKSGTPAFFEKTVDFDYRFKMPFEGKNLTTDPVVSVTGVNYTITGENSMEIGLQMAVRSTVYQRMTIPLVSDIIINEEEPIKRDLKSAMTIYFADNGESIWDIARKYLADVDEIKRINDISDDELQGFKMILIPMN